MQKTNNLQEIFLTRARKQSIPVTIFLVNGFQLRGVIAGFDCFVVHGANLSITRGIRIESSKR